MNKKEIQYRLAQKNKLISFHEENHEYYFGKEPFQSVTTIIKKFEPEFNKDDEISLQYAQKHGLTNESVKEMWQKAQDDSCELGTSVHKAAELSLLGLSDKAYFSEEYALFVDQINKFIGRNNLDVVATESILFSQEHKVAGQADFITLNDKGSLTIWDWKTSKKIVRGNPYDRFMLEPLSHLPNTNYSRYCLQLSIYRLMLEEWGFNVSELNLVHVSENFIQIIPCTYLETEARLILNLIGGTAAKGG